MLNIFKLEIDKKRIYGLDILRAFAIFFVVIQHGAHLLPKPLRYYNRLIIFDGVSIFFVLSGFLIGGILIKLLEKETPGLVKITTLFNFWKRRWLRTLPAYFFILFLLSVIFYFNSDFSIKGILILTHKYYIFSQNLITNHPWFFPEAWSLSVEEWFYLITPILIFISIIVFKISLRKSVIIISILILLGTTLIRFLKYKYYPILNYDDWDLGFRKEVFTRLDSLMYGIIGAYFSFYFNTKWVARKNSLFISGIILLCVHKYLLPEIYQINSLYNAVFSFSLMSLSVLCMLPFLSELKSGEGAFYKIITYLSLISYSLYLINYALVQGWIINKIDWTNYFNEIGSIIIQYFCFLTISILFSILLYKYLELPFMKLREKGKPKSVTSAVL